MILFFLIKIIINLIVKLITICYDIFIQERSILNAEINESMALCSLCYQTLIKDGYKAKLAVEKGILIPAVESIVEANTYLSGVGADNGGLAASHSVYNGFTSLEECEKTMH
jgi:glycerol dehydrogenase